ncbi:MAG: hypothetical protein WC440_02615 [Candidatus Omnitrophota bacterium]|jgi:hypothetical protein
MVENETLVTPGEANETTAIPEDGEKPCLPCLLPKIMAAWNSTRAACEFLPDPTAKTTCRAEMDKMAATIKDVKSAEEVILRAIESAPDPDAFIQAEVDYAIAHNAANSAALIKWAEKQEAEGKPLSPRTAKVISILRLEQGI